jgi:signal transduction histidine kinase
MTNHLFNRIRWRQVGWTMLIVSLILLFLGAAVYATMARSLQDQVDRTLLTGGDQALRMLGPGRRFQERDGYRGGLFYLVVGPNGAILDNPQRIGVNGADIPAPSGRAPTLATIQVGDDPVRVLVRPAPDGDRVVVGQSLEPEQNALRSLLFILLAGGGLGLLLALAGAWFLAGRALVPIQQAFQRQQEFVADASHELRTPLTVLQSSAELLNQHRAEPLDQNGELFDDIRQEIDRMVRLTSDLLTLARSDRGELELMVAPLGLVSLTADVVRRITPLAQARGVSLVLAPDATEAIVEADPDRLQQVLLILLDNAIKHTPHGGRVDVRVQRGHGAYALLEVADTGEGIAPQHLARLFDRFYRADAARSRDQGGTGLGLAIAKLLVEAHQGTIGVTSTVGAGTRVSVRLPLEGRSASVGGRLGSLAAHLAGPPSR